MKRLYFFLLLLTAASTHAQVPSGPDWRLATESETSWAYYNRARIVRTPAKTARVWVQYVNSETQKQTSIALYECQCVSEKARLLTGMKYSDRGEVKDSYSPKAPKWEFIPPDTIIERIFRIVCKGEKDMQEKMEIEAGEYYRKGLIKERARSFYAAIIYYEAAARIFPDDPVYKAAVERVQALIDKQNQ